MTTEQTSNITSWWEQQSFPGKELFKLDENGTLVLCEKPLIKERVIATLTPENCESLFKNLVEKFENLQTRIRETESDWANTEDKLKLADRIEHIRESLQHTNAAGDFEPLVKLVNEWDTVVKALIEVNVEAKTKLAELAESLAESTEWKEATTSLKEIGDKWKLIGYVDKSRNDKLWNRIEAARKVFHDRKRTHHDDEEKDLFHTLDLKIELAEQAEALANSEEWKATSEAFQKIIDTWKTIGRTLPRKNEELWQRIMAAKTVFYDRKKVHFTVVQAEQEANYAIKMALADKAEAMQHSTDWGTTAQAYAALMEEWKKTGRVPHEKADELWKRFTDAQELFFEARRKHTEETRAYFDQNYKLKSALLKRAEEIKNSSRWGETTVEMNRIFDEWKKIGPVPREHNTTMWDAFLGARKHFFNRKDEYRDVRRVQADAHRSARVEQAHTLVFKMKEEIAQEEEKLADFQNALENITPGKKAGELRTHLEVLIGDSRAKMKRLHEKLAAGIDELNYIEEKEKEDRRREKEKEAAPKEKAKDVAASAPGAPAAETTEVAHHEQPEELAVSVERDLVAEVTEVAHQEQPAEVVAVAESAPVAETAEVAHHEQPEEVVAVAESAPVAETAEVAHHEQPEAVTASADSAPTHEAAEIQ